MNKKILAAAVALMILTGCSQSPPSNNPTSKPGTPVATPSKAATASATPSATASVSPSGTATPSGSPTATGSPTSDAGGEGEMVTFETAGMTYRIPKGWKKEAPDGTFITSADGKMAAIFIEPEQNDIEEILKNIGTTIDKVVKDAKVEGSDTSHEINGMHSRSIHGTGKIEGKDAEWSVEVIGVKKPLIVVELSEKGAYETNQKTYDEFEASFAPVE